MKHVAIAACLVVIAAFAAALKPAEASCYEEIGCTDTDRYSAKRLRQLASCQILWEMRNGIFKENGYCFQTRRAINLFGNAECRFDNIDHVPLNAIERANVSAIKQAERAKGCS